VRIRNVKFEVIVFKFIETALVTFRKLFKLALWEVTQYPI